MDVLELARQRRAALAKEVAKLEQFIAVGEELSRSGGSKPAEPAQGSEQPGTASAAAAAPTPLRQYSAGGSQKD